MSEVPREDRKKASALYPKIPSAENPTKQEKHDVSYSYGLNVKSCHLRKRGSEK